MPLKRCEARVNARPYRAQTTLYPARVPARRADRRHRRSHRRRRALVPISRKLPHETRRDRARQTDPAHRRTNAEQNDPALDRRTPARRRPPGRPEQTARLAPHVDAEPHPRDRARLRRRGADRSAAPRASTTPGYEAASEAEIGLAFDQIAQRPIRTFERGARLSIAGAQEKLVLAERADGS